MTQKKEPETYHQPSTPLQEKNTPIQRPEMSVKRPDTPVQRPATPKVEVYPSLLDPPPEPTNPMPTLPASSVVVIVNGPEGPSMWVVNNHGPPPREVVREAVVILEARVYPKRKSGVGHKQPKLSSLVLRDLTSMLEFFHAYVTGDDITWRKAALDTSQVKGHGQGHARTLCVWGRACILDPHFIPRTAYGQNQDPLICRDKFQKELKTYLQEVGKYVTAMDVVQFTAQADVQATWGLTKAVSKSTAQCWMRELSYRWGRELKGLYFDGHEHPYVHQDFGSDLLENL